MVEPSIDPIANVMISIKSATNPLQLLDSVALSKSEVNGMSAEQFMRTLHTLFGLHKATKDSISADQIIGHPSFMILCRKLRRIAPSMDVSSNLNALKIVNYLKIPANTELSLVLVSLIRYQINDLSLQEIVYAEFLLNQLKPRLEKAEAIKAALPVLFEIQLPIQFDPENTAENIELLKFATSNAFSPKTVGMIANALSAKLGQMKVEERKEILRILCAAPNVPTTASYLWKSSLTRNAKMIGKMDLSELLRTTGLIVRKCQAEPIFYNNRVEHYLEKCVQSFIQRDTDLEDTVYLQKLLKNIVSNRKSKNYSPHDYVILIVKCTTFNFQSLKSANLLKHIDYKINANIISWPTVKLDILFTVVQAFASAGYKPVNWEEIILPAILENVRSKKQNPKHPTWLQFTLQLILLDHFEIEFVERVLCGEYLSEYMQRNNFSDTDLLKLVILYHESNRFDRCNVDHQYLQSIVGTYLQKQIENPFQNALINRLGTEKCLFNVRTKYGHCIQNLIKYDIDKQQFNSFDAVQRDSIGFVELDQIDCMSNERL